MKGLLGCHETSLTTSLCTLVKENKLLSEISIKKRSERLIHLQTLPQRIHDRGACWLSSRCGGHKLGEKVEISHYCCFLYEGGGGLRSLTVHAAIRTASVNVSLKIQKLHQVE